MAVPTATGVTDRGGGGVAWRFEYRSSGAHRSIVYLERHRVNSKCRWNRFDLNSNLCFVDCFSSCAFGALRPPLVIVVAAVDVAASSASAASVLLSLLHPVPPCSLLLSTQREMPPGSLAVIAIELHTACTRIQWMTLTALWVCVCVCERGTVCVSVCSLDSISIRTAGVKGV